MLRASLISLALLVGGGSVAFAEDPMPGEAAAQAVAKPEAATAPKADAAKPAKHHHKNKARTKKPAPKKHKHHGKKTK